MKTVGNLTVKNSLQDLDAKEMYIHPKNQSVSFKKRRQMFSSIFIVFRCLHDAFSKLCRLEFRFQNIPFSKSACKNVPLSCEREAYPSSFSPFSKCAGIV